MHKNFLFLPAMKLTLYQKYVIFEMSTYQLAKEYNTYPNMILRALKFHHIVIRDKSQSQKIALKNGRAINPMKKENNE